MPEIPETFEVDLPPAQSVPLRQGEERQEAALNMDRTQRNDSVRADLLALLKRIDGPAGGEVYGAAAVEISKHQGGASARKRRQAAMQLVDRLKKETFKRGDRWEGPCVPATVINLNPVDLKLIIGGDGRWCIPPAGKGEKINLKFKGRIFAGSYMTITSPWTYFAHTGTANDKQTGADMPAGEQHYVPPLGLAYQFHEHFVEGAADAQGMGGVLIFEGDIHNLDAKRLERSENSIWVPKKEYLEGSIAEVVYPVERHSLTTYLEQMLVMQRNFADMKINEGHSFATAQSDILRNQLSNDHRIWHNYALAMGYIDKALPWAVERLFDRPTNEVIYCPDCHERQSDPEQYFCSNCNAPFDTLKAFLAGKMVSPDRLAMYEGEDWDKIVAETNRRRSKIALLDMPPEVKAARARKPAEKE